jgi:hypothetical protein
MKERAWGRKIVLMTGLLSVLLCIALGSTAWAKIPSVGCVYCHDVHGGGGWLLKAEYAGSCCCLHRSKRPHGLPGRRQLLVGQ